MIEAAYRRGARVMVDGAQAVSQVRVDVQAQNCDFYVFSGEEVDALVSAQRDFRQERNPRVV